MTVFIVYESDFGHLSIIDVVNSLDKARLVQAEKESTNDKDWITYFTEEWDVK